VSSKRPAEKGTAIEVRIDSLAYGGRGVGRLDGMAVFVNGTMPGETVRAQVTKRKSAYAEATLLEVIEPSSRRQDPPCPLFGECGGCTWQHIAYEDQLAAKERIVRESVERIGGLENVEVRPIVPSPRPYHYRNKMEFSFGTADDGRPVVGFHRPGRWQDILEVPRCWLHPPEFDRVLDQVTRWAAEKNLRAYDGRTHLGFLRHLVIRGSKATGGIVVVLLSGESADPGVEALCDRLCAACPHLQGFVWGLNTGLSDVARMERPLWNWGNSVLIDRIGALEFRVSPESFFQTNTLGAELLYETARKALDLDGRRRLLDAYCGTGTIGLYCAADCGEVWGIEIVREAVWDARENAARNGITNARFLAGDIKRALPTLLQSFNGRFDRVVVDPPRAGMEKKALAQLLALQAPALAYVSCNPTTLGRDLQVIRESGYDVDYLVPVDMFPQTYHIEAVARCRLPAPS